MCRARSTTWINKTLSYSSNSAIHSHISMRDRCLSGHSVVICAVYINLPVPYIDVSLSDMQNVLLLWIRDTYWNTTQVMSMNSILACRFFDGRQWNISSFQRISLQNINYFVWQYLKCVLCFHLVFCIFFVCRESELISFRFIVYPAWLRG